MYIVMIGFNFQKPQSMSWIKFEDFHMTNT